MKNGLYFDSRRTIIRRSNVHSVTQKSPTMDQAKRLELEILLTVRNNRTVPSRKFYELFEQDWNLYRSKFNELIVTRFLKISSQIPGICVFELHVKGECRIDELLAESGREIESATSGLLNFLKRFQLSESRRDHLNINMDTSIVEAN